MNKRGISHLEVIFAFLMFISFVAFAIYFFNPLENKDSSEFKTRYILDNLIRNLSVEMVKYSVLINGSAVAIGLENDVSNLSAYVEDYLGETISFNKVSDKVYVINSDGSKKLIVIRFSDQIEDLSNPSVGDSGNDNYSIASVNSEQILSEKKLKEMNESYNLDYNNLKNRLGIPANEDFSFSLLIDGNEAINSGSKNPSSLQVFAFEKSLKILKANGRIVFGTIQIKIW